MTLTDGRKAHIDSLDYEALLRHWRSAPLGDPWFQGETGYYWGKRMNELRSRPGGDAKHVASSKAVGWER